VAHFTLPATEWVHRWAPPKRLKFGSTSPIRAVLGPELGLGLGFWDEFAIPRGRSGDPPSIAASVRSRFRAEIKKGDWFGPSNHRCLPT